MADKKRVHREWFRLITRKTCGCGKKKTDVYSWGEYRSAKWHTVEYVCASCWSCYAEKLSKHSKAAECTFELIGKDCKLPAWLCLVAAKPSAISKLGQLVPATDGKDSFKLHIQSQI